MEENEEYGMGEVTIPKSWVMNFPDLMFLLSEEALYVDNSKCGVKVKPEAWKKTYPLVKMLRDFARNARCLEKENKPWQEMSTLLGVVEPLVVADALNSLGFGIEIFDTETFGKMAQFLEEVVDISMRARRGVVTKEDQLKLQSFYGALDSAASGYRSRIFGPGAHPYKRYAAVG